LRTLSIEVADNLKTIMSIPASGPKISPFICPNNLDMEEKVHKSYVGHQSMTFHGAWG
jgi:hypothetical protein